jgi:hypothetical protein
MPSNLDMRRAHVNGSTPLRLGIAAKLAFPDGSITERSLRAEAKRGRLTVERIGNKDFTTLEAIERMRELCRVQPNLPGPICGKNTEDTQSTSSSIVDVKSARVLALEASEKLKRPSHDISRKNIEQISGNVTPLTSRSQM